MPEIDITRSSDFSRYYLQDDMTLPMAPCHLELHEAIDSGLQRIVAVIPRSMAKSTIFTKHGTIKDICVGSIHKITIVSDTANLAYHWLGEIRKELEHNTFIINDFGNMKTDKWTEKHIVCRRKDGTTVEVRAVGAGAQARGFRPHKIVVDDLENDENVRSEDQRAKLKDWFDKALINTLEPDGQMVMLGTMLHPQALLEDVTHRPGWKTFKYQAIQPDGTPLWPEKWPLDKLAERKAEIGHLAFQSEFMNEPIISENPIFIRDHFKPYETDSAMFQDELQKGLRTAVSIDPAISKNESADYTAIVTISSNFDAKTKHFVRKDGVIRGHWTINKQVIELVRLYDKFQASVVLIETVAYQEALAQELRRWCEENRRHINILEIKPDKDKERRAHAIVPTVERGQVYVDLDDKGTNAFIDEAVLFPTGDRDDMVDAFDQCMAEQIQWSTLRHQTTIKSAIGDSW
jgi:predicted phage terminase large subunit-like protein